MENFQMQAVREGFKQPTGDNAIEAKMTILNYEDEKMVITRGSEILWTQGMGSCRSVATYTPFTGVRSLTHLEGGNAGVVFYRKLVQILAEESRIIFVAGGADQAMGEEYFTTTNFERFREEMDKQLRLAKMASPPLLANYEPYYSDAGPGVFTGFVFKPDGRYGVWNPNGAP